MTSRIVSLIIRGDISGLRSSLTAASSSVRATADRITGASREAQAFRGHLSAVGDTAGKMGLAAAGGLVAIVATTAKFDKAMSAVQAATHESTAAMADLRSAAIKAGADTAFSATEAANGIEELAKAGVSTKDILSGGLSGSLDLAAAGALSVADAASIAATTLNQFSLGGDQATHVADLLTSAANSAQGSVADVGQALKYVGPVAAQMGVSLEETTGTIAELASQGILADQAGTSLRGMLSSLTSSSKIASDTMKKLGINVYDAQGNFVGFEGIAGQLQTTMGNLSNAERDQALGRLFGNEQITAARILYKGGAEDVAKWTDAVDKDGAAAETASMRLDNLSGDLEAFKGSLETALIGAGEGSQSGLRDLTQGATDAVNAFNNLPGPIQSSAVSLLGITAVLGGGLWFTAKTLNGVAQMRANLAGLGPAGARAASGLRAAGTAAAIFAAVDLGASLAESLDDRSTGEIDDLSKSLLNLSKSGKATGDLKDLFGADLGGRARSFNKDLKSLGDVLKNFSTYSDDSPLTEGFKYLKSGGNGGIYAQVEAIQNLDKSLSRLNENDPAKAAEAFAELTSRAKATGASAADIAEAFPLMSSAMDTATVAGASAAGAIDATGAAAADAEVEVKSYSDALKGLLEPLLGQDAAANAWKDSLASLTDDLKENGATISENTVKGRANQDAIRDRVTALKDSVAADDEAGVGQEKLSAKLQRGAKMILEAGEAAGISKGQMKDYLAQLGLTPKQIKTLIETDDKATPKVRSVQRELYDVDGFVAKPKVTVKDNASAILASIQAARDRLHDKTINIKVIQHGKLSDRGSEARAPKTAQANGGVLDFYADGGMSENHVAQIAPAGAWRVWAEPETGGEAYIPFAASKRKRSQQIAMETVSRLGGVASFANGGMSGGSPAPMSMSLVGARVAIDKDGIGTFVDGRVQLAMSGADNYGASQRRAGRKP